MIFWLIFIAFEIYRNYRIIETDKERPNYAGSRLIRIFFGVIGLCVIYPGIDGLFMGDFSTLLKAIPVVVWEFTSFSLLFDFTLNKLRKKDWVYQGENSGPIDKFSKKKYYAFKIVCLILLIASTIYIFKFKM